jgi:hypothetical protein
MIDPEAEQQMKVLDLMKGSEDRDVQFLLWQLGLDLGNEDYHRAIKSFRRQSIIAAADYAYSSC